MPIVPRGSSLEDAAAVTELLQASYGTLMSPAYDPNVLEAILGTMTTANPELLASGTYFVAEGEGGKLVGCGGWTRQVPGTQTVAEGVGNIRHFATHPDWLGRGLGRAIYSACEAQAVEAGITQFDCFSSLNAVGFYAALGFERIGTIDVPLRGMLLPGVLMRRAIRMQQLG